MAGQATAVDQILDQEDALYPEPIVPADNDAVPPPVVARPPAAAPAEPPPAPAAEPAATPPPADAQPAAPAPSTAEPAPAAPATAPPTEPEKAGAPWQAKREAERKAKEATDELVRQRQRAAELEFREQELLRELERQKQPPPVETPLIDDPLLAVEARIVALEQRNQELNQQLNSQNVMRQVDDQAAAFQKEHPDYQQALEHYVASEIRGAERTGELDSIARRLREVARPQVQQLATERGITEADASRELAKAVGYQQRLNQMIEGARMRGTTVAAIVYEQAQERGFRPGNGATTGAPRAVTPPPPSASEMVRQEQTAAAIASVAGVPRTSTPPGESLSYATFLNMNTTEQASIIDVMDAASGRGIGGVPHDWVEQMERGAVFTVPPYRVLAANQIEILP